MPKITNSILQTHSDLRQVQITLFYNDIQDLWDLSINGKWHPRVSGLVAGSLIEFAMMSVEVALQDQVAPQDCDYPITTVNLQ